MKQQSRHRLTWGALGALSGLLLGLMVGLVPLAPAQGADISSWSDTAASNNSAAPDGFPEGMAPSAVNDAAREVMAAVRRQWEDAEWFNWGDTVTYASGTTFTVAGDVTGRYEVDRRIKVTGATTGTIYGTITASAYTASTLVTVSWDSGSLQSETLTAYLGIIGADNPSVDYDALAGKPTLGTAASSDSDDFEPALPAGTIILTARTSAPSGWLLCGQEVSRTTYADLFSAIGTTFGTGDGSTTFDLPDMAGRAVIGVGTGSGLTARSLADTGGEESVTLTAAESGLPAHNHEIPRRSSAQSGGADNSRLSGANSAGGAGTFTNMTDNTAQDASSAHENMPPFIALNCLIKS